MSNVTSQDLSKAFELIEQDRLAEARAFIEPLLADNQDNPDLWWIYSHAVEDEAAAQNALQQVLRIAPDYQGASTLYDELLEVTGAMPSVTTAVSTSTPKRLSRGKLDSFDDFDLDTFEEDMTARSSLSKADLDLEGLFTDEPLDRARSASDNTPARTSSNRQQALMGLGLAALLVLLLVIVFIVINPFGEETAQAPTQVSQASDTSATAEAVGGVTVPTFTPETPSDTALIPTTFIDLPTETSVDETSSTLTEAGTETIISIPLVGATSTPTEFIAPSPTIATPTFTVAASPTETATTTPSPLPPTATETPMPQAAISERSLQIIESAFQEMVLADEFVKTVETQNGSTLLVSVCTQSGAALREDIDQAMGILARESRVFTGEVEAVGVELIDCEREETLNAIAVGLNDAIAFSDGGLTLAEFRALWRVID